MERLELLYEGKAKQVYRTSDPDLLIQHFKDDATAFNAKKRGTIVDKGVLNNRMSEVLFRFLESEGVSTHFVKRLSDRDMLIRTCDIVKVEVVARNIIAGSLAKRLGREEGEKLPEPILEHFYKDDALDDPMINDWHIRFLRLASPQELATINEMALRVNALLPDMIDTPENRRAMPDADFDTWARPAEIAAVIAWLCSPAARVVSGNAIDVGR